MNMMNVIEIPAGCHECGVIFSGRIGLTLAGGQFMTTLTTFVILYILLTYMSRWAGYIAFPGTRHDNFDHHLSKVYRSGCGFFF